MPTVCPLKWIERKEHGKWLKDIRGNLAMVAIVIATITFQVGLNPSGGLSPTLYNGVTGCPKNMNDEYTTCLGESVYAIALRNRYLLFMVADSISFFSSVIMCLSLISGLPLDHQIPTCVLAIGMCISLTALTLTYYFGAYMITPDDFSSYLFANKTFTVMSYVVGIAGFPLMMHFVVMCTAWNVVNNPNDDDDDDDNN